MLISQLCAHANQLALARPRLNSCAPGDGATQPGRQGAREREHKQTALVKVFR